MRFRGFLFFQGQGEMSCDPCMLSRTKGAILKMPDFPFLNFSPDERSVYYDMPSCRERSAKVFFEEARMMNRSIKFLHFFMAGCLFLLASCATTTLTAVWKDEAFPGPVRKIAVIGVFKTPAIRNIYEDEFVRQLKAHGVDAVASYTLVPIDGQPDQEAMTGTLRTLGMDHVLVTRLVDKKTVQTYIPGQVYVVPGYYRSWGGYYHQVYTPGYMVEDTYAFAETNIYDVKNDKLVWSARSETEVSTVNQELIRSFVNIMIDRLSADALIR